MKQLANYNFRYFSSVELGPQGMFAGEHIVRHVAHVLGKDVSEIGNISYPNCFDIGSRDGDFVKSCYRDFLIWTFFSLFFKFFSQ